MHSKSFFMFVLFALSCFTAVFAGPPPPPSSDIMVVTSPNYGMNKVGDVLYVQAYLRSAKFKKLNPKVYINIQKSIRYPKLNVRLGTIKARRLEGKGFRFTLKKEWLIDDQKSVPFRIRVSWKAVGGIKGGYVDSEDFYFEE
ncbi:hypothetical protein BGZ76_004473 [Entomortierella beljakovae]|nr:hypothetical protein BGZ76_004473 [Entomortierella beljakovae]